MIKDVKMGIFNDPIHIIWRRGTTEDPYKERTEFLKVVNNRTILSEVPDQVQKVLIENLEEIDEENLKANGLKDNQFFVDYTNGIIFFNKNLNGFSLKVNYLGKGLITYPSERIYHYDENMNVAISLNEIIESSKRNLEKTLIAISDYKDLRNNLSIETNNISKLHDSLKKSLESMDIAKDLALDILEKSIIIFKEYVGSFDEIKIKYPNPKVGWTTQAYDTGVRFRFDGFNWIPIDIFGGNIPLASHENNGLMSKDIFTKIESINIKNLNEKYVYFILSSVEEGVSQQMIPIPYSFEFEEIELICSKNGFDKDTIFDIEYSNNLNNWEKVSDNPIILKKNTRNLSVKNLFKNILFGEGTVVRLNFNQVSNSLEGFNLRLKINIRESA